LETTRKWRWGVNRWIVLGFIIFSIVAVNIATPVQPHIQVAPEKITEATLTLPLVGEVPFVNTWPTLIMVDVIIIALAWGVRQSVKKGEPDPARGFRDDGIPHRGDLQPDGVGRWKMG